MVVQDYMTKKELQAYLRICPATVQKLMNQRAIPYVKLGKRVLFRKSDVDKFMESKLVK